MRPRFPIPFPVGLLFLLLSVSAMCQTVTADATPGAGTSTPPEVVAAAQNALAGNGTVLRYGHLSDNDSLEAIAVVPAGASAGAKDQLTVSQLVILRKEGVAWVPSLTARDAIVNPVGRIAGPFGKDVTYKSAFANRKFDDGRQRFVIQLTPLDAEGKALGAPVTISWNEILGRYQQISLEGYGFQPELHGTLP